MPDPEQLSHILKLLDDDSETVQKAVAEALAAYGTGLKWVLAELPEPPNERQIKIIQELLKTHRQSQTNNNVQIESQFEAGQLIRHRRYGYRGVVVDIDPTCQADDEWYYANRTQPDRNQPWYYVLVHNSDQVTYAAQTSLIADESEQEISHPELHRFFNAFENGHYIRNNRPWPGQETK